MKKLLLLCAAFLFAVVATAQEFSVKSFEAKVTDLTAKINPVQDLNGNPCALIRVQIACKGCLFEGNIVGTPQAKAGEYLVYVPAGTRRLKISHPDFLPLTYEFNLKIEKNCTYELRITLPQNTTAIPELNTQFLVLKVSPQNAMVFIDDQVQTVAADGTLSRELPFGEHAYRVESPMYHPRRGTFAITESGRTELSVALDPAYGFLSVASAPENGARVFVDGKEVGTTPYKSDRMASGSYQVQVAKPGYYPQMQHVTVTDNRTAALDFALKANFAQITMQADNPAAEIWVSGKRYGTGRWTGRLDAGTYSVESRCEGYEKALQSVTVEAGVPQTIRLAAQTPIYGILKVNSTPLGATVKLDGKVIGDTPLISNKVLVGSHRVEVSKVGTTSYSQTVAIAKGQTSAVTATLASIYGTVFVTSTPSGAAVRIDGRAAGTTPFTSGNLSEGVHTVEISLADHAPESRKVEIRKNTQERLSVPLQKIDQVFEKAKAALKNGDMKTARPLLETAAASGNSDAQYELGKRCLYDRPVDKVKAYNLLLLSGRLAEFYKTFPYDESLPFKYKSGEQEIIEEITEPGPGYNNPASKWYRQYVVVERRNTGRYEAVYSTYSLAKMVRVGEKWGVIFSYKDYFIPCAYGFSDFSYSPDKGVCFQGKPFNEALSLSLTADGVTGAISTRGVWIEKSHGASEPGNGTSEKAAAPAFDSPQSGLAETVVNDYLENLRQNGTEKTDEPVTTSRGTTSAPYKVGDYYNENGREGIVFEADVTGRHGKIMAMKDLPEKLKWGEAEKIGASNEADGMQNLRIVEQIASWKMKFPAFAGCAARGEGWYLPAKDELKRIYDNRKLLSSCAEQHGGDALTDGFYWSSSEFYGTVAWYSGSGYLSNYTHKLSLGRVRPVAAF